MDKTKPTIPEIVKNTLDSKSLLNRVIEYLESHGPSLTNFKIAVISCQYSPDPTPLLQQILDELRARSFDKPIEIISAAPASKKYDFEDVKENHKQVSISQVTKDVYEQVADSDSVDVEIMLEVGGFLRKVPCFIESMVFAHGGLDKVNPEAREKWVRQAREDWKFLLELRQKELKSGGILFQLKLVTPSEGVDSAQGQTYQTMMTAIVEVLTENGLENVKEEFNLPVTKRGKTQLLEPFEGENSFGLKVDSYTETIHANPAVGENPTKESIMKCLIDATKPFMRMTYGPILEKHEVSKEKSEEMCNEFVDRAYKILDPTLEFLSYYERYPCAEIFCS
eukprot:CAMPEP_0115028710 /NCGR_PEP_ID=MMETSP0216-20121206/36502_1 /TAXON_ID=223996 /ORGANISM="Protocruzia adherens, Strain Boccale" /LENGTH=337 /DNA_ID=CAMNT_0002405025 /DNA_START=206 /DNA_END=1215 /DNA_ORIENTATION=-